MLRPALRYVALGDSYTIGTGVAPAERWPDQLVAPLSALAPREPALPATLELVANLAVNGWTSADVLRGELPRLRPLQPGFVTLLIGVNDVVQGVPPGTYADNVAAILEALLGLLPPGRLLTISTPDFTVTPAGADYGDPTAHAVGIRAANAAMAEASAARGIAHVDIHDLSLRAADDRSLIADDGLHPSGAQYALWVERIAPAVAALLSAAGPP